MANNIKGITIEIGGNTTKLTQALSGVNKEVKSTQSELKEVERLLKLDPKNTEALAQKQKLLKDAVEQTKEKLDVLKTAETQVQEQFLKGEVAEEQYRALKREIELTEQSLKGLEDQAKSNNISLENVGSAIGKVGEKSTELGTKLLPVTAGVVALGGAGIAAAMELDDGYDTIITKTGATGEALEGLNQVADNIFSNMPTTMDNVGTAVGEVNTRFGATGDTLEDLSSKFIQFAEINGTDLNNSIGKVDKIMEQWNIDMSDTDNVLGLITKKGQDTGISVDTLMDSVQKNGATFKEMGLNMVQSVDLMAQFEANGVNAETAIAGLKKSVKIYTDQGKSTDEALKLTIDSIKNAKDQTEALSIAQEVFGTKGAAEMSNAIREGRISIDDLSVSMDEYGTVVEETFNATLDPWDDATVAMNNLKLVGADLGSTLLTAVQPIISSLVQKVKDFTSWFKNLNQTQKETIIKIAAVIAAIGPALIIFGKVCTGISNIILFISKIGPAVKVAKAAFTAFKTVLLANPFALIVIAIVAVIAIFVTLYKKCEWFRNGVNSIWNAIKTAFFSAWYGIKNFFTITLPNAFNTVINFVKSNWQGLLLFLVNPFAGAFKLLYDNCEGFRATIDTLIANIKAFFQSLWDKISEIFTGVGLWFSDKFTEAFNGIVSVFGSIGQWFADRWTDITTALAMVATWYFTMWLNAFNGIVSVFGSIGQWFGARWNDIKLALAYIASWFLKMFQNAFNNISSIFGSIGTWFGARWLEITSALSGVAEWFRITFQGAFDKIGEIFGDIKTWFGARFSEAWEAVKAAFDTETIKKFFSGIWTTITSTFSSIGTKVGDAIGTAFKTAINSAIKTAENALNKVVKILNGFSVEIGGKTIGFSLDSFDFSKYMLAKGGVLSNGKAIVAEAGPELISMVNGKTIVTPLSSSAKNTAMENLKSGGSEQATSFVQNNNIYSPKALSPSESARQVRIATKNLVLSIKKGR